MAINFQEFFDNEDKTDNDGFSYNDDGEFISSQDQESDSNDLNNSKEDATDAEDTAANGASDDQQQNLSSVSDPALGRIEQLESSFDKLLESVERIAEMVSGKTQSKSSSSVVEEDTEDDDDFDFTDSKSLKNSMRKMISEVVKEAIQPIQATTKEQQYRSEINDLTSRFGNEFSNSIPQVKSVLEINPSIGITKAFELVRSIKGTQTPAKQEPQKTVKPNATASDSEPAAKMPKENLVQKASSLTVASGVSSDSKQSTKRASSVKDAFEAALAELYK